MSESTNTVKIYEALLIELIMCVEQKGVLGNVKIYLTVSLFI